MICIPCKSKEIIVNLLSDGYPVRQPFVTNLSAVQTKLTGSKKR